ncbi:hypothetical protein NQ314_001218 [Rhamnusium bicolor]|uniref:Uncharacterized protein n=1 Tax=Rhamnusium bicolor TaxID=1586634 RepID=A0AAV8ZVL7_9CUCU|nr:hypothetical protein NQ314_001218 [Rhamnusium bicolor]
MSDFKDLNRKRGSIKARLTNFKTYLDDLVSGKLDNKLDKIEIIELESRMTKIDSILSEFGEIQEQIESIVDDRDFEAQVEQRIIFENAFYKIMATCRNIVADNEAVADDVSVKSNSSTRGFGTNEIANNSVLALQARPKLPAIPLPKFNGNSANWLENSDWKKLDRGYDNKTFDKGRQKFSKSFVATTPICSFCKSQHYINNCPDFLKLKIRSRFEQARKLGLCLNCLKKGNHISKNCEVRGCTKCGAKHHTLLHYEARSEELAAESSTQQAMTIGANKIPQSTASNSGQMAPSQVTSVFVEKGFFSSK